MKYGLIGRNIANSKSPLIHSLINNKTNYKLKELDDNGVIEFLKEKKFLGINVTMPYKKAVLDFLSWKDDIVANTGVCNTIINCDGVLKGYNTDYYGFDYLIRENNIDINDKIIAILGTGATSETIKYYLTKNCNSKVLQVSCHHKKHPNSIDIQQLYQEQHIDIVINTTPVGREHLFYQSPIDIRKVQHVSCVLDINYYPTKSLLILDAMELGIKTYNGLGMLVAQAYYANELFFNTKYNNQKLIETVKLTILKELTNIVLIGMPYSGKSSIGQELARLLNKDFYDIDEEITNYENKPIANIINEKGINYFRNVESDFIKQYCLKKGVIATGGGAILNNQNIKMLKSQGVIVLLNRNSANILFDHSRPLSSNKEDYDKLYEQRKNIYNSIKDISFENNDILETAKAIKEWFDAIFNS
ncbi:MAG: hypothetical protein HUJ61_06440 [Bacilli bacterium]|nr:hypothetical protein [Bacilli bacterium]